MADVNIEMLKERLYKVASALFCISETCVEVSKQHISEEKALNKIRGYLNDAGMWSRFKVDQLIEECIEPIVSNTFDELHYDWLKKSLDYYSCCDGCSNNPKNGGSGICNCALPYMTNPINYNGTPDVRNYMYYTTNTTDLNRHNANSDRITQAIERTQKYIKE